MQIILSVCRGIQVCFVRLVGQEPAPSKCVLMSTFRVVRKDMRDWVFVSGER